MRRDYRGFGGGGVGVGSSGVGCASGGVSMSAGDVTLTDAEKITLCICRRGDRSQRCMDRIAAVERILAARTPTATGDDLRDRVTALADEWDARLRREHGVGDDWTDWHSRDLRAALAASSAPVVSRPEAVVKAEALRGIRWRLETACDGYAHLMDDDVPWDADADSYQRGAHDAAEAIRAASLDSDAP